MTDATEILDKAYRKRLNWIEDELNGDRPKTIKDILNLSLLNTQIAIVTFQEYGKSLSKAMSCIDAEKKAYKDKNQVLINHIKDMKGLLPKINDKETKALQLRNIEIVEKSLHGQIELQNILQVYNELIVALNFELVSASLAKLYSAESYEEILETLWEWIQTLVSATPPGWIIGVLQSIEKTINIWKIDRKEIDDYLFDLETYNFASIQWCVATQLAIDLFNSFEHPQMSSEQDIEDKIQRRIDELLSAK